MPKVNFNYFDLGVIWGNLLRIVPEKGDSYVVPIRTLMLLGGGALAVFGSEKIGFEGAGPLGVVFAAFVSNYYWCQQGIKNVFYIISYEKAFRLYAKIICPFKFLGWEIEDNPVATAFEIFWMIFEPILFGITGAAVKVRNKNFFQISIL